MINLIIKIIFFLLLIASNHIYAEEILNIKYPTLTYEQAKKYADINLESEGINLTNSSVGEIEYDYLNGEWIIFYHFQGGGFGAHLHIRINDQDPAIYEVGRGA